jgi:hypothetical protein
MAHRRSLGFARDDKKERVVPRKGRLLNRGILSKRIWTALKFSRPSGTDLWFSIFRKRIVARLLAKVAPEAARVVIVHHSSGLHPGVDDDWADEFEAALFELR